MMRALSITMLSVVFAGAAPIGVDQKTATSPQSRATKVRVSGFDEIQSWFQRLHQHQPWQADAAVSEVAKLSPETLQTILEELGIVRQLLYDAGSKGIEEVRVFNRRLKTNQLAALMGFTDTELGMPGNIRHLARPDNPARVAIGRLMIRAAVLHTVIALSPEESRDVQLNLLDRRPIAGIRPGEMHSTVRIQDGRQISAVNLSMHWTIAREALDLVGVPRATAAAVRGWYHATAADMQIRRDYAALQPHLAWARRVLDADALTFLMSGAAYENLAAPPVQAAIAEADLGGLGIGTAVELRAQAERHLRRALELDPASALARLRLGRVLQLAERHADAAALLRQAESRLSDSAWRYFAALYLGRAEVALNRDEEARAAYRRAIALFPKAQSPRLALVEMAERDGDTAAAVSTLRALFQAVDGAGREADPWWTYDTSHVSDAQVLWDRMRAVTGEAAR